ncbi:MAG: methyltransferase [Actinomycetota bacterium]
MSDWDDHAADWDADPGPRAYAAAAFDSLLDVLAGHGLDLGGARVCDFGCGTGLLTELLVERGAVVDAVDTSPAMLDVVRSKVAQRNWSEVRIFAGLGEAVGPYDLIVCSSVLSFVDDHPATVERLASTLRPGGVFAQWDWERDESDGDDHGLTASEIESALHGAGLVDVVVGQAFVVEVDDMQMAPLLGRGAMPA